MTNDRNERDRTADGKFSHGNAFWRLRDTHGRTAKFETGEVLWRACVAYFDWAAENPLQEDKVFSFQGEQAHESVSLMRAFTLSGLCLHLGITEETWRAWRRDRPDLADVIKAAEAVIFTQKFEGAAAGLLNANIIARDLGLSDRQQVTGKDGGPVEVANVSDIEAARRIAFMLRSAAEKLKTNETDPKANEA